jgi:glutaredoxin 2
MKIEEKVILYHYWHCPFCIRVRLVLGLLGIAYESRVLSYDDEKTPVDLCGKKMLPIISIGNHSFNESKDIIKHFITLLESPLTLSIEKSLEEISEAGYLFFMPFWSEGAEFNEQAKKYFEEKKGKKRGPFSELREKRVVIFQAFLRELEIFWKSYGEHLEKCVCDRSKIYAEEVWAGAQLLGLYDAEQWISEHPEVLSPVLKRIFLFLQLLKEKTYFERHFVV